MAGGEDKIASGWGLLARGTVWSQGGALQPHTPPLESEEGQ